MKQLSINSSTTGGSGISIEGVLDRITYVNEENGWSVVRLLLGEGREPVTAVGHLLGIQPGESLRLSGEWIEDRRFGKQFKVASFITVQPSSVLGMEKYLGSGLVRGIGKVMAGRLVRRFGARTFEVIEQQPHRITEVEGIGPKRKSQIIEAWEEQRAIKDVMLFLHSHGVTTAFAVKIYKQYGDKAISVVQQNPYRLALDIFGVGFLTADRIALNIGVAQKSPQRAEAGVVHILGELADQGHVYCPRGALVEQAEAMLEIERDTVEGAVTALAKNGRLVLEPPHQTLPGLDNAPVGPAFGEEAVYLEFLHRAESEAAGRLREILSVPCATLEIDLQRSIQWCEQQQGLKLARQQREAVRRAAASKVLVITGGPGTGKTTIVNTIIHALEAGDRRVLLCAPTGRAAKRMNETTGREARTVHRLLEFDPQHQRFMRDQGCPLDADLLVVDEMSMVDIALFRHLLQAVPSPCRLILVGDVDQLPSVGPGSVLRDLISSGAVDVVRLTEIFRQARESLIVTNAHRINRGEMPQLDAGREGQDFFFIERDDPRDVLSTIKEIVSRRLPRRFGVDPLAEIQVLTPMHKGLLGSVQLNRELQALLNPGGEVLIRGQRVFRTGDKVMQVRNNYDLEVFNGDIGRIRQVNVEDRAAVVIFDGRPVTYDFADLDELVLGYACSIHKSQGSEYPVVVIPIHTQHFVMLQRNLLYTGVTRGRRVVVLVGSSKAVSIAVKNNRLDARATGLDWRLAEVVD